MAKRPPVLSSSISSCLAENLLGGGGVHTCINIHSPIKIEGDEVLYVLPLMLLSQ
jgi:hypothetical protein